MPTHRRTSLSRADIPTISSSFVYNKKKGLFKTQKLKKKLRNGKGISSKEKYIIIII